MAIFRKLAREKMPTNSVEYYCLKRDMARAAIEHAKITDDSPMVDLYMALTHLATIEELDIPIAKFDSMLYEKYTEVPESIMTYINDLMYNLDLIIARKVVGVV